MKLGYLLAAAALSASGWAAPQFDVQKILNASVRGAAPKGTIISGQVKVKFTARGMADFLADQSSFAPTDNATLLNCDARSGWTVWSVDESTDIRSLVRDLQQQDGVAYAEPVFPLRTLLTTPNDADWGKTESRDAFYVTGNEDPFVITWDMDNCAALDGWSLWPNTYYTWQTKPKNIPTICVIDSGCDMDHPDFRNLDGKTSRTSDGGQIDWTRSRAIETLTGSQDPTDLNDHGTHVAGTCFAAANNGAFDSHGMAGVGYGCQGMILRFIGANGQGSDPDGALAIRYAADHGADIINMSFGSQDFGLQLEEACRYAFQKGCVLVAAASETSGDPTTLPPFYPAASSGVFSVTAAGPTYAKASYAGNGNYIDITAPGGDIIYDYSLPAITIQPAYSTTPRTGGSLTNPDAVPPIWNEYSYLLGTSMAAPHVSGTAGNVFGKNGWRQYGGWSNVQAIRAIERAAQPTGSGAAGSWDPSRGYGDLDVASATAGTNTRNATMGSIKGRIYYGTPTANAVVTAKVVGGTSTYSVNSDSSGFYRFGGLPAGNYNVTAKYQFSSKTRLINVVAGGDTPGADFFVGGFPDDTTPPEIRRFELAAPATSSSVTLNHWGFDTESGIDGISIRLGTTQGASDIRSDQSISWPSSSTTLSGLSLQTGVTYWARITCTNGNAMTSTADVPFRVGTPLVTVSGNVLISGVPNMPIGTPITFTLRAHGSTTVGETHTVVPDLGGNYSFTTAWTGPFDLSCQAPLALRRVKLVSPSGTAVTANCSLTNGDCDGNNGINILDYAILSDSFNSALTSPNWDARADLDRNDAVNILDYAILSDNFNQVGDL